MVALLLFNSALTAAWMDLKFVNLSIATMMSRGRLASMKSTRCSLLIQLITVDIFANTRFKNFLESLAPLELRDWSSDYGVLPCMHIQAEAREGVGKHKLIAQELKTLQSASRANGVIL